MTTACRPTVGKGKRRTRDQALTKPTGTVAGKSPTQHWAPTDARNIKAEDAAASPHLSSTRTLQPHHTWQVIPTPPLGLSPKRWAEVTLHKQQRAGSRPSLRVRGSPQPRPRRSLAHSLRSPSLLLPPLHGKNIRWEGRDWHRVLPQQLQPGARVELGRKEERGARSHTRPALSQPQQARLLRTYPYRQQGWGQPGPDVSRWGRSS